MQDVINVPAIGPGGEPTGRTYSDYQKEAQRFAMALFDVYKEGDGTGRPFFFPKPLVHITDEFFRTPGHEEFLLHICDVASDKGNTYFVFDRGETAKISECCRLSFKLEQSDLDDAKEPWRMRYSALQNVTLNLPRAAYYARGDDAKLFEKIDGIFALAVKAHQEKRQVIEKLLAMGDKGPLALLTMDLDGQSYLRMHRVTYLIGLLGLNELVQAHIGQEIHDGLGQKLTALSMMAASLKRDLARQNVPESRTLNELIEHLRQALEEARALSRGLAPVPLTEQGLAAALNRLAEDMQAATGIACHFETDPRYPVEVENRTTAMQLYRIAQEAVHNAIKHGRPRNISIRLVRSGRCAELRVSDDGSGFRADIGGGEGFGLRIMRYRAAVVGAEMSIESTPESGTLVRCKLSALDLQEEDEEEE